jgi:SAM-dependent methyltransferase
MKLWLLELLACPECRSGLALNVAKESGGEIESGLLTCEGCSRRYPIVAFIPRFVPESNYADGFGFQWNRFRQTQLDSHTGIPISTDRFFRQSNWSAQELAGKKVLDIGCGSGRFAEVALSCGAKVVALDYSSAVDACRVNLGSNPNLHLLQGDVYALPLRRESFDYVYCFGVLQHTPEPEKAFFALPPLLKPGGRLAVDIYLKYWGNLFYTKYWLRPATTRLRWQTLFGLVERGAPALLALSRGLGRVPKIGSLLRRLVPVANYEGVYPLNDDQLLDFAVLDTFDMLSPAYDRPQTPQTLRSWLTKAGLEDIQVSKVNHLVGRGRKNPVEGPQPGRAALAEDAACV